MTAGGPRIGTVVIPAFNESHTVARSLAAIADVLGTKLSNRCWEIVVVDDGSADRTAELAAEAAAALAGPALQVRVVRHAANRGLGAALQTGFTHSTGDVVVVVDCDLSYHPSHIPDLVDTLDATGAQVVVASPYMSGGRTLNVPPHIERRSRLANRFLAAASKTPLATYTGMVRAYEGEFVRRMPVKSTDQRVNVEILYKTRVLNGRIVEIPATLDWSGLTSRSASLTARDRRVRAASYRTLLDGLLFRPYLVFLAGGALLATAGLAIVLLTLLTSHLVDVAVPLGTAMICSGALMAAASLLSIQVKRCFEELYYQQAMRRQPLAPDTVFTEGRLP